MTRAFFLSAAALLTLTACGEKADAPAAVETPRAEAKADGGVPPLGADGLPRFRPGLWEVVKTDSSNGEGAETSRDCVGEEANEDFRKLAAGIAGCKTTKATGPAGLTITSECEEGGVESRTMMTVAGTDKNYRMTLDMQFSLPDGKTSGGQVSAKARWIGACPAGMKPGDSLEADLG